MSERKGNKQKFCRNVNLSYNLSCLNVKEDEIHFLFVCPLYEDLREMHYLNDLCQGIVSGVKEKNTWAKRSENGLAIVFSEWSSSCVCGVNFIPFQNLKDCYTAP